MSLPFRVPEGGWCERSTRALRLHSSLTLQLGILVLLTCAVDASYGALPSDDHEARSASPLTYAMQHWDTDDGLPSHTVSDIRQAPDGYLWMATTAGLIRFDGSHFTVFDQRNAGIISSRVARFHFTPAGGLRIIADDESVLESPTTDVPRFVPVPRAGGATKDPSTDTLSTEELEDGDRALRSIPLSVLGAEGTGRLTDRFGNVWTSRPDAVEVRRADGSAPFWSHSFPAGTRI